MEWKYNPVLWVPNVNIKSFEKPWSIFIDSRAPFITSEDVASRRINGILRSFSRKRLI